MINHTQELSRRAFVQKGSKVTAGLMAGALLAPNVLGAVTGAGLPRMRFGLVTYQWGRDWNLPTLLRNCERTGTQGVELRVEHAHQITPSLNQRQRRDVRLRFEDSPVALVGFGTNYAFHYPDETRLREEIEGVKEYVRLSDDVGSTGVKVKPNALPEGVPVEETLAQISHALNQLGQFAADYGQEIRVEVHGAETQQLPIIKRIFDGVEAPNVGVCWNCNEEDLDGRGLEYNFNLVKDRLGRTTHIRELNVGDYPYQQLFDMLAGIDYEGWMLMEARTEPVDRVKALAEQRELFDQLVSTAQSRSGED